MTMNRTLNVLMREGNKMRNEDGRDEYDRDLAECEGEYRFFVGIASIVIILLGLSAICLIIYGYKMGFLN